MAATNPASLSTSNAILLSTVIPGTILAIVGSFLTWYDSDEHDFSRKGTEVGGVGVTTLAIACLLAAVAFIGLKGRPTWLLGIVFVLALVPGAEAGNYVALIEQSDGTATAEGLYIVLFGLGLAVVGSASAFLLANLARGAGGADGSPTQLSAVEPPEPEQLGGSGGPAESGLDS